MSSFNIINIHIIVLENQIEESVYNSLIYFTIKINTYKHQKRMFFFLIYDRDPFFLYSFTIYTNNRSFLDIHYTAFDRYIERGFLQRKIFRYSSMRVYFTSG